MFTFVRIAYIQNLLLSNQNDLRWPSNHLIYSWNILSKLRLEMNTEKLNDGWDIQIMFSLYIKFTLKVDLFAWKRIRIYDLNCTHFVLILFVFIFIYLFISEQFFQHLKNNNFLWGLDEVKQKCIIIIYKAFFHYVDLEFTCRFSSLVH